MLSFSGIHYSSSSTVNIQPDNPFSGNALSTQVRNPMAGKPLGGFGYIDTGSVGAPPRGGMIVARLTF